MLHVCLRLWEGALRSTPKATSSMASSNDDAKDDQLEEDDEGLDGAIGFMFDSTLPKRWVQLSFPLQQHGPIDDGDHHLHINVEVACLDDEEPGALQSGHYIWPAAAALSSFLARTWDNLQVPTSPRVLELGAGCGLVGLTVAQLEAADSVMMTDHDPGTLKLIQSGVDRQQGRLKARCAVQALEWGSDEAVEGEPFDLIVGSDLIYSQDVVMPLLHSICRLLGCEAHCKFVLAGSFDVGPAIQQELDRGCAELGLSRKKLEGVPEFPDTSALWLEIISRRAG